MKEVITINSREDIIRKRVCSGPFMTAIVLGFIGCILSLVTDASSYSSLYFHNSEPIRGLELVKHILVCVGRISSDVFICCALGKMHSVRSYYKKGSGNKNGLNTAVNLLGFALIARLLYLAGAFIDLPNTIGGYLIWALIVIEVAVLFAAVWMNAHRVANYIEYGDRKGSDTFLIVVSFGKILITVVTLGIAVYFIIVFCLEAFFTLLFWLLTGPQELESSNLVYYSAHAIMTIPSMISCVFWIVNLYCFKSDKNKLGEVNYEQ